MHQFVVLRILIAGHHPGKSHQVVCGQRGEVDTSKPGRGWNDGRWIGIWRSGGRRRMGGTLGVAMGEQGVRCQRCDAVNPDGADGVGSA
jgi:hypothetical protein